jgi:hypothetical protein
MARRIDPARLYIGRRKPVGRAFVRGAKVTAESSEP